MCNKACDGDCYPPMYKAGDWKYIKNGGFIPRLFPKQNTYVK